MVQVKSRDAALTFENGTVTYLKDVAVNIDFEKLKSYDDDGEPDILEYGDVSYTFTATVGYVDHTVASLVLARTKADVEFFPEGDASAKDLYTLSNCICNFGLNYARGDAEVKSSISGEGTGLTITHQT